MASTSRIAPRGALAGVLGLALVVLFVACGAENPAPGGTATAPAEATATAPAEATATARQTHGGSPTEGPGSPTASPTEASPEAREIEIEVEEGRVKGPGKVAVDRGDRVVLVVEADVADEVHVHGYDLLADVRPGEPARIAFVADAPGVFEVELESAGLLLTRLEVRP